MKNALIVLAVIFTLVVSVAPLKAGEAAIESISGDDHKLDTSRFEGSVVYLDFWASWCKPCRKSFQWMARMHESYAEKGLVIVAVGLDNNTEDAREFLARIKPSFRIVLDPNAKMAAAYDLEGMPCSFLFDRDGVVQSIHTGFRERDRDELEQRIRIALGLEVAVASPAGTEGAAK